jgi:hypothetical protein
MMMMMTNAYRGRGVPEGLAVEQPHDVSRRHGARRLALQLMRLSGRQWRRWHCDSHNSGLHCNTRMLHDKETQYSPGIRQTAVSWKCNKKDAKICLHHSHKKNVSKSVEMGMENMRFH